MPFLVTQRVVMATHHCRIALVLVGTVLTLQQVAVAQGTPTNQAKIRQDFVKLAPYLSMDGEIWLEMLDAPKVAGKVARIHEYAKHSFDSHPILSRVGQAHMAYLIEQETRVVPAFRAQNLNGEEIFMELFSRVLENEALRRWQLESDQKHRSRYAEVMPIVEMLSAKPESSDKAKIEISTSSVTLSHQWPQSLVNVTLVVKFVNWAGESTRGYYFLSRWDASTPYKLRLPSDVSQFGRQGVVEVHLDLYSETFSTAGLREISNGNLQYAVDSAVQRASQLVRHDPVEALALLKIAQSQQSYSSTAASQIRDLQREAKDYARHQYVQLRQQAQNVRNQIRSQETYQRRNKIKNPNMISQMMLQNNKRRLEQLEEQIDRLKAVR